MEGGGGAMPAAPEDVMQINEAQASLMNEREVVQKAGKERINDFLRNHVCYDLLKHSGKVVVFDASIPVQLAFYALVEHDMQAAPLWDSRERRFVGLMTVTDFIDILRHYRGSGVAVEQLASKSISEVLSEPEGQRLAQADFVHVDAEVSLLHAASLFQNRRIKFLPVIVPGSATVLALISHVEILEFLVTTFREQRRLFDDPISDLRIGIFSDSVVTVHEHACLSEVLDLLELHGIGAVPIVDAEGRVVGIYSRSDITFLATAADPEAVLQNLKCKLSDILGQPGNEGLRDRLITCSPHDTLQVSTSKRERPILATTRCKYSRATPPRPDRSRSTSQRPFLLLEKRHRNTRWSARPPLPISSPPVKLPLRIRFRHLMSRMCYDGSKAFFAF